MGLILVTGGTGTLGRIVVRRLEIQGHNVRVLSRRPPPPAWSPGGHDGPAAGPAGDLRRDRGIDAAVAGADVIVHCATGLGDVAAAGHLIDAARRAGRPHLAYISIVGVDRVPVGYYKSKLAVERQVESSGLPGAGVRGTPYPDPILRGRQGPGRPPASPGARP